MANNFDYIFSLYNTLEPQMKGINVTTTATMDRFAALQTQSRLLEEVMDDTGVTIGTLRERVAILRQEKEWLPADDIEAARQYNKEIEKLNKEIEKTENAGRGDGIKKWVQNIVTSVPVLKNMMNPMELFGKAMEKVGDIIAGSEAAWNSRVNTNREFAVTMNTNLGSTESEIKSLLEMATAEEKSGIIGKNTQLTVMQTLSGHVEQKESIEKLLPAMNNLIAQQYGINASQEEAQEIAGVFGKVMKGETDNLKQYGIKLNETTKKTLEYGTESERASTLAHILGEYSGNANQILASTPEGRWKQHSDNMLELQERIGSLVVQFRDALFPVFEKVISLCGRMVTWFQANGEAITAVISGIATVVGTVLGSVFEVVSELVSVFGGWFTGLVQGDPLITGITTSIGLLTIALNAGAIAAKAKAAWDVILAGGTKLMTVAQSALNKVFLANPIGLVILGLGALVTGVIECWNRFEGFRKVVFGVWNLMKEFGKTLFNAVVDPVKKIIAGLGVLGDAVSHLFKGNFAEAAKAAKEGMKEIGQGMIDISPVGIVTNVVQNGNWSEAWEEGQEQGIKSWERSQTKKKEEPAITGFIMPGTIQQYTAPTITDISQLAGNGMPDFNTDIINLDDQVEANIRHSSLYRAVTRRDKSQQLSQSANNVQTEITGIHNRTIGATEKIGDITSNGEQKTNLGQIMMPKTSTLEDIMFNVRRIAAAVLIPVAFSIPAQSQSTDTLSALPEIVQGNSEAYKLSTGHTTESYETFGTNTLIRESGRGIYVDKVCEQVVINVQNTDGKGVETIRAEIMRVLNELYEI